MFEQFGFSFAEVNGALAKAEDQSDAFNIFEGLKIQLTLKWEDMQAANPKKAEELRIVYDRLQGLKLSSYKPPEPEPDIPEIIPVEDEKLARILRGDTEAIREVVAEEKQRRRERFEADEPETVH